MKFRVKDSLQVGVHAAQCTLAADSTEFYQKNRNAVPVSVCVNQHIYDFLIIFFFLLPRFSLRCIYE